MDWCDVETFCEIVRDYARQGLRDFKNLPEVTQRRIKAALEYQIEDDQREMDNKFAALKHTEPAKPLKLLPMPKPGGKDFLASFFLPRITYGADGAYTCTFHVLWWIDQGGGKTIAMRLEPADAPGTAHAYTHWQFTRTVGPITTSSERWLPKSYPAIPLGYRTPVQLFMGVAAAVHGYGGSESADFVRQRIYQAMRSTPSRAEKLLGELRRMVAA